MNEQELRLNITTFARRRGFEDGYAAIDGRCPFKDQAMRREYFLGLAEGAEQYRLDQEGGAR